MPTRRFWFTAAAAAFMTATRPTALPDPTVVPVVSHLYVDGCAQPWRGPMPIALQPGCEGITGFVDRPRF